MALRPLTDTVLQNPHTCAAVGRWYRVVAMKRLLLAVSLGLCALIPAPEARCTYCPTYPCYGECGGDCTCVRRQPWEAGQCLYIGK